MSTKTNITTLVSDLSLSQSNTTEAGVFFDEIIRELGFIEILTGTENISITSGDADYKLAPFTVRALEFNSSNGFLADTDDQGLGSLFGASWRSKVGTPQAVNMEEEDDDTFRLVPKPNFDDIITVIRTEYRDEIPDWLDLPVTFEILSREFQRESDHQDIELANLCKQIATLMFNLVGVQYGTRNESGRS